MADGGGSTSGSTIGVFPHPNDPNPIKTLYPFVNEDETPIPRSWSAKDRYNYIGLSQNNLRVHYKGFGKTHKDAASVRATHSIPAACGLYYFEVKVISKGRDGYMGIGLSIQGLSMNRLPGWDKNSYGYHGDDGHSFCSSGQGQPYGPTFTTGDVIGCGVNLVDRTCFYTLNGVLLGTAFRDLPKDLYPTVGLQTPGEVVDANFGTSGPFVFDLRAKLEEVRASVHRTIIEHPLTIPGEEACDQVKWADILNKMVTSYLVHHGYCSTAEAFARASTTDFTEEVASIRNRQRINKLIMSGNIGGALALVEELYPTLLKDNPNLLFRLKVRQFIEILRGTEQRSHVSSSGTNGAANGSANALSHDDLLQRTSPDKVQKHPSVIQSTRSALQQSSSGSNKHKHASRCPDEDELNARNNAQFGDSNDSSKIDNNNEGSNRSSNRSSRSPLPIVFSSSSRSRSDAVTIADDSDAEMDCLDEPATQSTDGSTGDFNGVSNGVNRHNAVEDMLVDDDDDDDDDEPEVHESNGGREEMGPSEAHGSDCGGCGSASWRRVSHVETVLAFGRELQAVSEKLRRSHGKNKANKRMLQDAFSLLAYNEPCSSPLGWQLDTAQREPVCQALNSAILESQNLPARPSLEVCASHTQQLVSLMSRSGLGASAFTQINSLLNHQPKPYQPPRSMDSLRKTSVSDGLRSAVAPSGVGSLSENSDSRRRQCSVKRSLAGDRLDSGSVLADSSPSRVSSVISVTSQAASSAAGSLQATSISSNNSVSFQAASSNSFQLFGSRVSSSGLPVEDESCGSSCSTEHQNGDAGGAVEDVDMVHTDKVDSFTSLRMSQYDGRNYNEDFILKTSPDVVDFASPAAGSRIPTSSDSSSSSLLDGVSRPSEVLGDAVQLLQSSGMQLWRAGETPAAGHGNFVSPEGTAVASSTPSSSSSSSSTSSSISALDPSASNVTETNWQTTPRQ
ncbi:LIS1 motif [Trinorchestia longiramus]|nr:LIS1 motif [Trinorchestia longiramus]